MGFDVSTKNYANLTFYVTTSKDIWPTWHMLACTEEYAKHVHSEDRDKIVVVCANMDKKEWHDRTQKSDLFNSFDRIATPLFPNNNGISISDIQNVAEQGCKVIYILDIDELNGKDNYEKLKKLSAIANLYNVCIIASYDPKLSDDYKFEKCNWPFIDFVRVIIDDPKDDSKCIYEDYEPATSHLKRIEPKKKGK